MNMPNFLMIGAPKTGSSSLYRYLEQHPDIFVSRTKEPSFFAFEGRRPTFAGPGDQVMSRAFVTDLDEYQKQFRNADRKKAAGEASTVYLYNPDAPANIKRHLPGVKLIAILRDPAERAYSGYLHLRRDGRETAPTFEAGLAEEDARVAAGWEWQWHYTRLGLYGEQLRRYYELFPPSQLAVLTYDDFQERPLDVIRRILEFLDVDPGFVPDMRARDKVAGRPRSKLLHRLATEPSIVKSVTYKTVPAQVRHRVYAKIMEKNVIASKPPMRPETRALLVERHRTDLLEAEALSGLDLSQWRRP